MNEGAALRRSVLNFFAIDSIETLSGVREEVWAKTLPWLDRSGLALPLAARFEALRPNTSVPRRITAALRLRLRDNHLRMQRMLDFLHQATRALNRSGARYCYVKGFSLIPDCFDGIRERHQVDLDFLVAREGLVAARRAIESLGYRLQYASSSGEVRFIKPWERHIAAGGYLYQLPEAPPIELHAGIWEASDDEVEFPSLSTYPDAPELHEVCGVEFPRLQPTHHFIYLLLHIFRHVLGSWTRLLSLYEVAAFIRARRGQEHLWADVAQLIRSDERLSSVCALIFGLVDLAFPLDLPDPLEDIYSRNLSPESALWLDICGARWLLAEHPGNKLNLIVQKQFWTDGAMWRQYLRRRLLPVRPLPNLSDEAVESTRRTLAYRAEEIRYQVGRVWYHLKSDATYLAALLRWIRSRRLDGRSMYQTANGL